MKKKNEGFTLVELVIAIVVLAIAVSPLLANFIQSSKMNLKSHKKLNAMNLAQDIMEGMSQYTVSENLLLYDGGVLSANSLVDVRILPGGTTLDSCEKDAASTEDTIIYHVNGIQVANVNYNKYDVNIKFDSSVVNGDAVAAGKYNDIEYADIAQVDRYYDIVYTINSEEEGNVYKEMNRDSNKPFIESSIFANYKGNVSREININIDDIREQNAPEPKYQIVVDNVYTVLNPGSVNLPTDKAVKHVTTSNLSRAESNVMPRSIYLYYEGLSSANMTNKLEKININNTTGNPITVYLIRTIVQPNLKEGEDPWTQDVYTYNLNYGCDVYVNSEGPDNGAIVPNDKINIVSNLRMDLCQEDMTTNFSEERSKVYLNSTLLVGDEYDKYVSDGYHKAKKDVLYDVTLEIKEAGKSNVVATYTGGMSN